LGLWFEPLGDCAQRVADRKKKHVPAINLYINNFSLKLSTPCTTVAVMAICFFNQLVRYVIACNFLRKDGALAFPTELLARPSGNI
jgi:hypothetical protein